MEKTSLTKEVNTADASYPLAGYIFVCNSETTSECFKYSVFGLAASDMELMSKIKTSTKLFLYDFNVKLLYGVFTAISDVELKLESAAFGGKLPAQIKFEILSDCIPLPESAFKHAIKDNYEISSKFRQEISQEQVNLLMSLFLPTYVSQPLPAIHHSPISTSPPLRIVETSVQHHSQRILRSGGPLADDFGVLSRLQQCEEHVRVMYDLLFQRGQDIQRLQQQVQTMRQLQEQPVTIQQPHAISTGGNDSCRMTQQNFKVIPAPLRCSPWLPYIELFHSLFMHLVSIVASLTLTALVIPENSRHYNSGVRVRFYGGIIATFGTMVGSLLGVVKSILATLDKIREAKRNKARDELIKVIYFSSST